MIPKASEGYENQKDQGIQSWKSFSAVFEAASHTVEMDHLLRHDFLGPVAAFEIPRFGRVCHEFEAATSDLSFSFILYRMLFWSLGGFRRIAAPSGQIDRQDGPQASHRFGLCRTSVDCTCFDQPCLDWPWIAHMESAFLLWFEEKKRRTMHTLFWMLSEVGGKVS